MNDLIEKKEKLLKEKLYRMFPESGLHYTIFVTKWSDGTFKLELRHAEIISEEIYLCHHWFWYKNRISYTTTTNEVSLIR
jgi:hypothetical protein